MALFQPWALTKSEEPTVRTALTVATGSARQPGQHLHGAVEPQPKTVAESQKVNVTNEAVNLLKIKIRQLSSEAESRQVTENKYVGLFKAVDLLKTNTVILFWKGWEYETDRVNRDFDNRYYQPSLLSRQSSERATGRGAYRGSDFTERSRNVIDIRSLLFLEFMESRNVYENKGVSPVKPECY